jgi:thiamine biosynthesis protein ThiS
MINVNEGPMAVPAGRPYLLCEIAGWSLHRSLWELNGSVIPREAWSEVSIPSEATLEIVRFVGGGYTSRAAYKAAQLPLLAGPATAL